LKWLSANEVLERSDSIQNGFAGTIDENKIKSSPRKGTKVIDIALVGNPNSGKTTIFNFASGSNERVGNYSGVTIDSKQAKIKLDGYTINIIDLPGTYSLTAYTPEELHVRKYILGFHPDVVVNVIDASNLERNLYLTTQLIDMDVKVVVALNMYDEFAKKNDKFDHAALAGMMGIPIIPTVGAKGKGITDLLRKVIDVYEEREPIVRHIHINYGINVEMAISAIQDLIEQNKGLDSSTSARFYAIKLLEKDKGAHSALSRVPNYHRIKIITEEKIKELEKIYNEDSETLLTDSKYGFIAGALKETYEPNKLKRKLKTDTEIIDTFITHKIFGFPIFILFLWVMFQATFKIGEVPQNWIESLVTITGDLTTFLLRMVLWLICSLVVSLTEWVVLLYFFPIL
jgi:ferrous iron transport protein B